MHVLMRCLFGVMAGSKRGASGITHKDRGTWWSWEKYSARLSEIFGAFLPSCRFYTPASTQLPHFRLVYLNGATQHHFRPKPPRDSTDQDYCLLLPYTAESN